MHYEHKNDRDYLLEKVSQEAKGGKEIRVRLYDSVVLEDPLAFRKVDSCGDDERYTERAHEVLGHVFPLEVPQFVYLGHC